MSNYCCPFWSNPVLSIEIKMKKMVEGAEVGNKNFENVQNCSRKELRGNYNFAPRLARANLLKMYLVITAN